MRIFFWFLLGSFLGALLMSCAIRQYNLNPQTTVTESENCTVHNHFHADNSSLPISTTRDYDNEGDLSVPIRP